MWKRIIIALVIIAIVVGGYFFIKHKRETEKAELKKEQLLDEKQELKEQAEAEERKRMAELKRKNTEELLSTAWSMKTPMGDTITIYFNENSSTIEKTLSNQYTSEENSTPFTFSEDGKTIYANEKKYSFSIKNDILTFGGNKYKKGIGEKPTENQELDNDGE